MNRYFLAMTDTLTAAEASKCAEAIQALGVGWWHWLAGSWLIVASIESGITASSLRDLLMDSAPGKYLLVTEVPAPLDWAGAGPKKDDPAGKSYAEWLDKNWRSI